MSQETLTEKRSKWNRSAVKRTLNVCVCQTDQKFLDWSNDEKKKKTLDGIVKISLLAGECTSSEICHLENGLLATQKLNKLE